KARALVQKLADSSVGVRERAVLELASLGLPAVPLLREAAGDADPERGRRAQECLRLIEKAEPTHLPQAAARLVALRRPAGAAEALLGYLPFAESDALATEVQTALNALAAGDAKPDQALIAALGNKSPPRRAAAAEALCRNPSREARQMVANLLK